MNKERNYMEKEIDEDTTSKQESHYSGTDGGSHCFFHSFKK